MKFVPVAVAAEIFCVSASALKKAARRNSKKYTYKKVEGRFHGGCNGILLFAVSEKQYASYKENKNENTNRSDEELVQWESERSGRSGFDGREHDSGSLGVCGGDERVIGGRSANGGVGDKEAVRVCRERVKEKCFDERETNQIGNGYESFGKKGRERTDAKRFSGYTEDFLDDGRVISSLYDNSLNSDNKRIADENGSFKNGESTECCLEATKADKANGEFVLGDRDVGGDMRRSGADERSAAVGAGCGVCETRLPTIGRSAKLVKANGNSVSSNETGVADKSWAGKLKTGQEQELWLSFSEEKRENARLKYELVCEYEKSSSMRAFLQGLHPKFLCLEVKKHKVFRWLKIYKNALRDGINPILMLADARGKAKKPKSLDEDMQGFIVELVLKKPDISLRMVESALKKQFMAVPTSSTISRFMASWKSENVVLYEFALNPTKAVGKYRSAFGSMDEAVVRVNQLWEFDATPADVITRDGKRWTVSALMDIYSRRVVVVLGESSSSYLVSRVFREGIKKFGVPLTVRTDNGADYTSNHFDYICSKLRVNHELTPPFQGYKKPFIERFFGTLSRGLFKYLHGYVGANVAEKMQIVDRKTFEQKLQSIEKWKARHKNGDEFAKKWSLKKENRGLDIEVPLTKDELMGEIEKWINVYENEFHSGIKTTPMMKFSECSEPIEMISNERVLDVLMGETKERVVQKKGIFVDGHNYVANELWEYVGRSVLLYMDDDLSYVYVYSSNYEYICRAECPEMLGISRNKYQEAGKEFDKFARKVVRLNESLRAGGDTLMRDYLDERVKLEPVVLTIEKKEYVNESLKAISESVESEKVEVNEKVMFESLYERFLWCFENDKWDEYSLSLKDEFAEDYERAEEHFRMFSVCPHSGAS